MEEIVMPVDANRKSETPPGSTTLLPAYDNSKNPIEGVMQEHDEGLVEIELNDAVKDLNQTAKQLSLECPPSPTSHMETKAEYTGSPERPENPLLADSTAITPPRPPTGSPGKQERQKQCPLCEAAFATKGPGKVPAKRKYACVHTVMQVAEKKSTEGAISAAELEHIRNVHERMTTEEVVQSDKIAHESYPPLDDNKNIPILLGCIKSSVQAEEVKDAANELATILRISIYESQDEERASLALVRKRVPGIILNAVSKWSSVKNDQGFENPVMTKLLLCLQLTAGGGNCLKNIIVGMGGIQQILDMIKGGVHRMELITYMMAVLVNVCLNNEDAKNLIVGRHTRSNVYLLHKYLLQSTDQGKAHALKMIRTLAIGSEPRRVMMHNLAVPLARLVRPDQPREIQLQAVLALRALVYSSEARKAEALRDVELIPNLKRLKENQTVVDNLKEIVLGLVPAELKDVHVLLQTLEKTKAKGITHDMHFIKQDLGRLRKEARMWAAANAKQRDAILKEERKKEAIEVSDKETDVTLVALESPTRDNSKKKTKPEEEKAAMAEEYRQKRDELMGIAGYSTED
eukprot:m.286837 g.286837  ORF g.286837 m.286837 type:complete len:576 (+) comp16353_c2_seq30:2240-3967(+)